MMRTWLVVVLGLSACGGGEGANGGGLGVGEDPVDQADAGSELPPYEDEDAGAAPGPDNDPADAGAPGDASAHAESDAGFVPADDSIIDAIDDGLTCKATELDPIIMCVTVTCPMQPDPLSLANCLLSMCAPMVDKVNPKCKECVSAGIAQDVAGLLENCLDLGAADAGPAASVSAL